MREVQRSELQIVERRAIGWATPPTTIPADALRLYALQSQQGTDADERVFIQKDTEPKPFSPESSIAADRENRALGA